MCSVFQMKHALKRTLSPDSLRCTPPKDTSTQTPGTWACLQDRDGKPATGDIMALCPMGKRLNRAVREASAVHAAPVSVVYSRHLVRWIGIPVVRETYGRGADGPGARPGLRFQATSSSQGVPLNRLRSRWRISL